MTTPTLIEAARAVVARWDSPKWADAAHTRDYIDALRAAIEAAEKERADDECVWSYDFCSDGHVIRGWLTADAHDAFAAGNFNQRAYVRKDEAEQCSASGDEPDTNARLGLAGPNGTCEHEYRLDARSGITICNVCGRMKRTPPAPEPARQPMTDEQRMLLIMAAFDAVKKPIVVAELCMEITRAVEAFHRIGNEGATR